MPDQKEARDETGLSWVIVDGVARAVSEFAATPPRQRPFAFCPHCGQRLTLKLGTVLRHHAAHRPGADCPATHPESALHLDCKFALAAALQAAAGPRALLTFRRTCADSLFGRCYRVSDTTWEFGWDEVQVEHRLGDARRPDVLLLLDGTPVGAIEVVVSHTVTDDKAKALATLGIPWVEIDADPARRRPGEWPVSEVLDARRVNSVAQWRCVEHEAARVFRAGARMAVREPSPPGECVRATVLRAARVVDLYHATGQRERFIYRILEQLENGVPARRRLFRGNLEIASVERIASGDTMASSGDTLRSAFRADVAKLRGSERCFADSPMRWAREGVAEFIANEAMFDRRLPDPTVLATTFPRRWFYSPDAKHWFLPNDFRDVRWDRDADDPLAPHPASARSAHASSTTRPAREGSWSTFIFARRPSGAMFGRDVVPVSVAPGVVRVDVRVDGTPAGRRRSVFIVERETDDATLARVIEASSRQARRATTLWLSHPRDWRPAFDDTAWAPAGCDRRARGAIVIDGTGVFRADAFMRAVATRDRRLSAANVRTVMTPRIERLRQRSF